LGLHLLVLCVVTGLPASAQEHGASKNDKASDKLAIANKAKQTETPPSGVEGAESKNSNPGKQADEPPTIHSDSAESEASFEAAATATRPRRVTATNESAASPGGSKAPSSRSGLESIGVKPQSDTGGYRTGVLDVFLMLDYRRDEIKYTGRLTPTLQSPGPVPVFFPPDQPLAFVPGAFQPNDDQLTGYASIRFKDFGFEKLRFSTQASFRYWGDLNGTAKASPFTGELDGFVGRRVLEPLTFFADTSGFITDDRETKFNLRVGRHYVYGAESVRLDGATLTVNHPRVNFDVFGGRRVTFFSDPDERGVVGGNVEVRATARTTFKYEFLHYIQNSSRFHVSHRLGESWALSGNFFLLDTDPIDLGVDAFYLPYDGKTRLMFGFLQKLTSDDFIYDYTYRAFANNPENQIFLKLFPIPPTGIPLDGAGRLNLLEVNPYTQFYVDGYRNLSRQFGVGGSFWLRQVNDSDDAGPFDTSFQELRVNGDWFPSSLFELGGEYRFRNVSRNDPDEATEFPDIRREGETKFHEVYGNGAFHLFDDRLTLEAGLFYRRFNTQSRLISFDGLDTIGVTGGIRWRINRNYRLLFEYGIDDEFPLVSPDIDYTQNFRIRFEWRFSR
jgi:hypothetical protein